MEASPPPQTSGSPNWSFPHTPPNPVNLGEDRKVEGSDLGLLGGIVKQKGIGGDSCFQNAAASPIGSVSQIGKWSQGKVVYEGRNHKERENLGGLTRKQLPLQETVPL